MQFFLAKLWANQDVELVSVALPLRGWVACFVADALGISFMRQ